METLNCWISLHGYIVIIMFLPALSEGSECETPSSPQCFRRNSTASFYQCEWSMNTTEGGVVFDFYLDDRKLMRIKTKGASFSDSRLVKNREVDIWVKAHVGNSSCSSPRRKVILKEIVKYKAPQNISFSWFKNNLNLTWMAAEVHPAVAEVSFRKYENPTESWEKRLLTTNFTNSGKSTYEFIVGNLLKKSAYVVQIRHQSKMVPNPLWSDWSPDITVPAELEQKPEVTMTKRLVKGVREVTLSWTLMQPAGSVQGLSYILKDTQSSSGCPCERKMQHTNSTTFKTYVSYSAVNISVVARNAAGYSPPAIIPVPAEPGEGLNLCDKTLLAEKMKKKTCLEWLELQDGEPIPENKITLKARLNKQQREKILKNLKDNVHYLYFKHSCVKGKPQSKMCIFYQEGVPQRAPQDFTASKVTDSSTTLSWKAISPVEQRGVLTHYSLCSMKIRSEDGQKKCHNIPATLTEYRLDNLTPGMYNISIAGVTRIGEGPYATVMVIILRETLVKVWLGVCLPLVFALIMCTFVFKRIYNKIFPPVPKPVILYFTRQAENKAMLETEEEQVGELTLHQLHSEDKSRLEDTKTTIREEWDDKDAEEDRGGPSISVGTIGQCVSSDSTEQPMRGSRDEETTDTEQLDNELMSLLYRKGLVFDMKMESS